MWTPSLFCLRQTQGSSEYYSWLDDLHVHLKLIHIGMHASGERQKVTQEVGCSRCLCFCYIIDMLGCPGNTCFSNLKIIFQVTFFPPVTNLCGNLYFSSGKKFSKSWNSRHCVLSLSCQVSVCEVPLLHTVTCANINFTSTPCTCMRTWLGHACACNSLPQC